MVLDRLDSSRNLGPHHLLSIDLGAIHDEGAVTDVTWSTLAQRLDSGELVELLMLIAHYIMLSTVLRSLRVQLEPSAAALADGVAGGPSA